MTIREIAQKAGVSPATVSIVINGKKGVSESTRKKVLAIVAKYGYGNQTRKKIHRKLVLALRYVSSGLLVEENQGFISSILAATQTYLENQGYSFVSMHMDRPFPEGLDQIDFGQYCGLFLVASEISRHSYDQVEQIPIPYIVLDNPMPELPVPSVGINNRENIRLLLDYAVKHETKQIGLLKSSLFSENFYERELAFYEYCERFGLEVVADQVFELTPTLLGAHEDMDAYLDRGIKPGSCFLAQNDMIALGAMASLKKHGYHMPKDIRILGFDNIPFAEVSYPPLTTVDVRREVIGTTAARALLAEMEQEKILPIKVVVSGELVERRSF